MRREKETDVITGKLIDRNLKPTRVLCLPGGAPPSSTLLLVAVLAILGAFTGCGDPQLAALTALLISPANSTIDTGHNQQFTAKGTYSDGSTNDLTNLVIWNSSNTAAATISSSGLALGRGRGTSTISATFNTVAGPVRAAASLTVIVTLK